MADASGRTVAELLGDRRGLVLSAAPGDSVLAALGRMAEHDVGALVVLEGNRPVGVFSERDLARKVELRGRAARDTAVRDAMTPEVLAVTPQHTVGACMALMGRDRVRHLVVAEGGRVVGVVSARDILAGALDEQTRSNRELMADRLVMTTNTGAY